MAANKPKQPYAILGTYSDVVTRLQGFVISNGGTVHLVHRSRKNRRTWTCDCRVGQKGYCCDAQAAYMAWANKEANAKSAADEAKAAQVRAEAVAIRNDNIGPRIFR